jgi:hypothetical protein
MRDMFRTTDRVHQTVWAIVGVVFVAGWAVFGLFGGPKWLLAGLLVYIPVVPVLVAVLLRRKVADRVTD